MNYITVMKQALENLDEYYITTPEGKELVTAIRARLEQPAPVQEPERDYSCKVCSNKPDADGWLEHGSGCYTQSAEGGGSEFIPDAVYPPPAAPVQEPVKRWAVFCGGCRKEWSVQYQHSGKSICAECETKLKEKT